MTLALSADRPEDIRKAGEILRGGGLVAIPTETVYGLAAAVFDPAAVARVFAAKGRPADNPLIVHVAEIVDIPKVCAQAPPIAPALAKRFWPGPLTLVMPRRDNVPDGVTAGLPTVAVRCPANDAARAVIRAAGVPLAAPSANRAGFPSPTTAAHVWNDMDGRVDAILDGGPCRWGVESTILDLTGPVPRLLRPGGVTRAQLEAVLGTVEVDPAVTGPVTEGHSPRAPGMKYRHYAPHAPIYLLHGPLNAAATYVKALARPGTAVLCFNGEQERFRPVPCVPYGDGDSPESLARGLFEALRKLDAPEIRCIYARCPEGDGLYEAVRNRLSRAAGFAVIEV
ncbi:MAG: threonylcarbamoyl-AMP synthase [Oscillospiraceae bacterium]|jgi:L-threonylcarbamoyladenylate synthase|nr:threonylcarbamoyl-AMP synthase [Oscillospiraceae bacterium]